MLKSWIADFKFETKKPANQVGHGFVYFVAQNPQASLKKIVSEHASDWQMPGLLESKKESIYFVGQNGPVWIFAPEKKTKGQHYTLLDESSYSWARDQFGSLVGHFKIHQLKQVQIHFASSSDEALLGAFVGMEMGAYSFKEAHQGKSGSLPEVTLFGINAKKFLIKEALQISSSVNFARHLVNLPPNELNPSSFAQYMKELKLPKTFKYDLWNSDRLKKEGMFLHLSVGQGAEHGPCMLHLQYRPTRKSTRKPVAFVGKGITFDTGGLDIKNSSGMRLMKKDMGGAAAVAGVAQWVAMSQYPHPVDFYFALAENSVDAKSFRPGDIYKSRSGLTVEIDNTDAEGRLVLADCLDVAVTAKGANEPEIVINVATLTGAIKAGLGAEVAGMFSNQDKVANQLLHAGARTGDYFWRMPLVERYFSGMSSNFADMKNSSDGWGGAVTAALFLQKFVKGKPWIHLDIYAWNDKAHGALNSAGGNGQPVQAIIEFLKGR